MKITDLRATTVTVPLEAPLRAAGTPDKPFGFHDASVDGGVRVVKLFLAVGRVAQADRLAERAADPRRRWKSTAAIGGSCWWSRPASKCGLAMRVSMPRHSTS